MKAYHIARYLGDAALIDYRDSRNERKQAVAVLISFSSPFSGQSAIVAEFIREDDVGLRIPINLIDKITRTYRHI